MLLSIIIPTKDRAEIFNKTLFAAIEATKDLQAEIIIVNDSKSSIPIIPESGINVRLFNNPKSGVASARNFGVKNSSGKLLLFLDNDIVISKKSVEHIIELHSHHENICVNVDWKYPNEMQTLLRKSSFGRFMLSHGMTTFKGWYNDLSWKDKALFKSKSVASFHLSMSRKYFELTKGYDEQFPHAGFEDYDFPKQLSKAGMEFYIDSRVAVDHNESDRLGLENWLDNQERRAATRKVAVKLGYLELELQYGLAKSSILKLINFIYPLLKSFLKILPNQTFFDPLYFKLISVIQAARIYKGYISN